MLTAIIPKVFYEDVSVGVDLFTGGVGMQILHRDDQLVVLSRDRAKVHLVADAEFAAKDRPELSIETDSIDEVFGEIVARRRDLLHPHLSRVKRQPWGAREFALLDASGVCVVFRDWTSPREA